MKTNHRWLQATIKFTADNRLAMPWADAKPRRDWRARCAVRAKSSG